MDEFQLFFVRTGSMKDCKIRRLSIPRIYFSFPLKIFHFGIGNGQ